MIFTCGAHPASGADAQHRIAPLTKAWETPLPHQAVPDGLKTIRAEECGTCHTAIYAEWKQSTHANALRDPQFQAEIRKDNYFACMNCHTPLQDQFEKITSGLIDGDIHRPAQHANPHFDPVLKEEAITCATCHVRNGAVVGPTGSHDAPHAVVRDTAMLSERLCMQCHNVVDTVNAALVCTFETGEEWKRGWAPDSGKTCISCHMPKTHRAIADGTDPRAAHVHTFPGSGIPKIAGLHTDGLQGLQITTVASSKTLRPDDSARVTCTLTNRFAGHNLPTGDPERFITVDLAIRTTSGKVLAQRKERIGEVWQWYPVARKISDNNLAPMETRTYQLSCAPGKNDTLIVSTMVVKHRMTPENARADGLMGTYPLSQTVATHTFPITVER